MDTIPNYSIIENGQNTEKSPGDLRERSVTQTSRKNDQLTLMGKLSSNNNNNNDNNNSGFAIEMITHTRLVLIKKKIRSYQMNINIPANVELKKGKQIFGPCQRTGKVVVHEDNVDSNYSSCR